MLRGIGHDIAKIPLGKCFFQILAKIEMTQNENCLFSRNFEMVQHFILFFLRLGP